MWIMLIKKLPTSPSPPRLSIFWSVPWGVGFSEYANGQAEGCCECGRSRNKCVCAGGFVEVKPDDLDVDDGTGFDLEFGVRTPNWVHARKIHYKGHDIRVFPHEFSVVDKRRMAMYILHEAASHILVADSTAEEAVLKGILDGETRPIYDLALMDGCTPAQAMATALGSDITLPDPDFPPIGWYRCRREYAEHFCEEWEMEE